MSKQKNYFENENLTLKEWCDKMDDEGYELKLSWDGGNDEGYVNFFIDDQDVENKYSKALVECCYDVLDYGSWAGDFSATGSAYYSKEEGAFVGEDKYSVEEAIAYDCDIDIKIPADIWFDEIDLSVEESCVTLNFSVSNGFISDKHNEVAKEIQDDIEKKVDDLVDEFSKEYEYSNVYEEFSFSKDDFIKQKDGSLLKNIDSLNIRAYEYDDKDIFVDIEEAEKYLNDEN